MLDVDKENNIEENIKRCEQLIKPEHANWIGISNQLAIAHLIERIRELEEENVTLRKANNITKDLTKEVKIEDITHVMNKSYEEFMSQFIPKQKVKDLEKKIINCKIARAYSNGYYYDRLLNQEYIEVFRNLFKKLLEDK